MRKARGTCVISKAREEGIGIKKRVRNQRAESW